MGETAKVYSLGQVTCNLLGQPLDAMGGWGEGQGGIKLEKTKPSFNTTEGNDGSVVWSATLSKHWKITLTILSTAGMNAFLSAVLKAAEKTQNGSDVGPLFIKDRLGANVFHAPRTKIIGWPNLSFVDKPQNVDWVIEAADGEAFWGGS